MRDPVALLSSAPDWMNQMVEEDLIVSVSNQQHHHYRCLFISDVHLGSKGCNAEFLADFLKYNHCDKLYMVGDIIDGWSLKKKNYWPQAHTNVIRRVLTMAKRGTEVVFVTGNHDEFLRRYSGLTFGNIQLTDEVIHTTANGKQLLVLHGDKFDAVIQSHRWLAFLGDWAYETLLYINTRLNWLRKRLGYGYWSLSAYLKHKVKSAVSFISRFEDAVIRECRTRHLDGVVCGHIHHPEIRHLQDVNYYNCGDWVESCTALAENEQGEIRLIHWVQQSQSKALHPATRTSSESIATD